MNTTESDAFLAAILAAPHDDSPRLVYADWLDEHGKSERAEFIRVQCELAQRKPDPKRHIELHPSDWNWVRIENCGKCPYCNLKRRECELLSTIGRRILYDLSNLTPGLVWTLLPNDYDYPDFPKIRLRRGFIAEVSLPCEDWLAYAREIVQETPLERVTLSDKKPARFDENAFAWRRSDSSGFPDTWQECLPRPLFAMLSGADFAFGIRTYSTPQAALDDLSNACLLYAREQNPSRAI